MKKSTAVLIHGCHVETIEWSNIIWGNPARGVFGRVPKGLQVALEAKASVIYWGTGASETPEGLKDSEYTYTYAKNHVDDIGYEINWDWVEERSFVDLRTQNTTEEITRAVKVCQERGVEQLIIVSSPTHLARCLQEAMKLKAKGKFEGIELMAIPSDTYFADSTPGDVVILEPPHRGDDPMLGAGVKMNEVVRSLLTVPVARRIEILLSLVKEIKSSLI